MRHSVQLPVTIVLEEVFALEAGSSTIGVLEVGSSTVGWASKGEEELWLAAGDCVDELVLERFFLPLDPVLEAEELVEEELAEAELAEEDVCVSDAPVLSATLANADACP